MKGVLRPGLRPAILEAVGCGSDPILLASSKRKGTAFLGMRTTDLAGGSLSVQMFFPLAGALRSVAGR